MEEEQIRRQYAALRDTSDYIREVRTIAIATTYFTSIYKLKLNFSQCRKIRL